MDAAAAGGVGTRRIRFVMPGLVPGIHVLRAAWQGVDGRDKPGHDDLSGNAIQEPKNKRAGPMGRLSSSQIFRRAYFTSMYLPSFTVSRMRERSSRP
ncbi:hypothetical protein ABIA43_003607 [Bradyrhizobium sp. USDA 328]